MKTAWCFLLLMMGSSVGCVELSPFWAAQQNQPAAPVVTKPRPGPVLAAQINDKNAHDKAEALRQELDNEAQ